MRIEEYREGLIKVEEISKKAKAELAFNYAIANNPHKKGDIIQDGKTKILIQESDVRIASGGGPGIPTCVFRGPIIQDDATRDEVEWGEIWQTNIIQDLDN